MPLKSDRALRLEAYVVPEISNISNEHVEVVKNDFPHLRDLWFSDVCQRARNRFVDRIGLLVGVSEGENNTGGAGRARNRFVDRIGLLVGVSEGENNTGGAGRTRSSRD